MSDELAGKVIGLADLQEKFRALGLEISGDNLETAAIAGALPIQNAAKENAPKRTRNLSRSIHIETVEREERYVLIGIGTDVVYAAIQEFGGTIVPKNVKYLAIPLTSEARQYVSPLLFPGDLHPVFSGINGALVDSMGVAQYALRKSVTIEAKPYLRPALDNNVDEARQEVTNVLVGYLEKYAE